MKKLLILMLALTLVLAIPLTAAAVDLPGGKITLTAQAVDYVSALAGIAEPVCKAYVPNERYAVLVTVDVPIYMDVSGMAAVIKPVNCTVDSGAVPVETGAYILTGTVLAPGASVKVTVKDNAIAQAATAGQLWEAIYRDRTVSATATLGAAVSQAVTGIPKTGGRASVAGAALCLLLAAGLMWRRRHV